MPVVWFDDEARIVPDIHSQLSTLIVSLNVAHYVKYILTSLSLLGVMLTAGYIFVQVKADARAVDFGAARSPL